MKIPFIMLILLGSICSSTINAQRAPRFDDRYHRTSQHNRYLDNVDLYDSYYSRMCRNDRKRFKRLLRRLDEEERYALADGYISRRERRRINLIQYDIDDLLYDYRRQRRRRIPHRRSLISIGTPFCR